MKPADICSLTALTYLLEELRASPKHHSTEVLRFAAGEKSAEGSVAANMPRHPNAVHNDAGLKLHLFVIASLATQSSNNGGRLIKSIARQKPSRTLREPDHEQGKEKSKDYLERDGEAPSQIWRAVACSEVDPVCDDGTDCHSSTLDADEQTSVRAVRAFGLVRRDSRRIDAVTDTGDRPSNDKLSSRSVAWHSGDLYDHTNYHDDTTQDDGPSPPKLVSILQLEECADQTSNLVDGRDETLPRIVILGLGESVVEVPAGDDARHDSLIVAEQQEPIGGYHGDEQRQSLAGQTHVMRHPMAVVFVRRRPTEPHLV